jgi:hypothetical protein
LLPASNKQLNWYDDDFQDEVKPSPSFSAKTEKQDNKSLSILD